MATKTKAKGQGRKSTSRKRAVATDVFTVMVLDMSFSMMPARSGVVAGANEYLTDLKKDAKKGKGVTLFSLTAFDTVFEHWHVGDEVLDDPLFDSEEEPKVRPTYMPRGNTALYDAIAHSIEETERKLQEIGRPDMKVLHVTLTDGGENASKHYSRDRLASLVRECEAKGNWTFVYLGAGHVDLADAQYVAQGMGYAGDNAMYAAMATPDSVRRTVSNLGAVAKTRKYASASSSPVAFADAGQSVADYHDPGSLAPSGTGTGSKPPKKGNLSDLLGGK